MAATLFGRLRDKLGHAQDEYFDDAMRVRTASWAVGSDQFSLRQHATIPVLLGHDDLAALGAVEHLELAGDESLWLVAELFGDIDRPRTVYLSSELEPSSDGVMLRAVAVTDAPALVCARPCRILPGNIRAARGSGRVNDFETALLTRAADSVRARRRGTAIRIEERRRRTPQVERLEGGHLLVGGETVASRLGDRAAGGMLHSAHRGRILSVR
jgi:hypothetical protein